MTYLSSASVVHHDSMIDAPEGRLFTRVWQPASAASLEQSPIVLLHDSLGCVELWRSFPTTRCHCVLSMMNRLKVSLPFVMHWVLSALLPLGIV